MAICECGLAEVTGIADAFPPPSAQYAAAQPLILFGGVVYDPAHIEDWKAAPAGVPLAVQQQMPRSGGRGGVLPWALLVAGSLASLAANVAVAEPTATGRVIAAWPSFGLIEAYELLMRQIRPCCGCQHASAARPPVWPPGRCGVSRRY